METFEDISDELIIVGSRYGVLSDVLSPLYEKGDPIEQEKIKVTSGTGTLPPNMSLEIMELPKSFCYFNFSSYLCRQM